MPKRSGRLSDLAMSVDGKRQLGHVGGVHPQLLADRAGLADALTAAMRRPGFRPAHARGQILVDLACAIVLGAVAIGDIAVLEHQRVVLGPVASPATVWRTLDETGELQQRRIARARAEVRRRVWNLLEGRSEGFPWTVVDGRPLAGWTVLEAGGSVREKAFVAEVAGLRNWLQLLGCAGEMAHATPKTRRHRRDSRRPRLLAPRPKRDEPGHHRREIKTLVS